MHAVKLFILVTDAPGKLARVFVRIEPFVPSLIFVSKARASPSEPLSRASLPCPLTLHWAAEASYLPGDERKSFITTERGGMAWID